MRVIHPINPNSLSKVLLATRPVRSLNLTDVVTPAAKAATAVAPTPQSFSLASVRTTCISTEIAQSLGYGDIVKVNDSEDVDFYLVEFLASTDEIAIPSDSGHMAIINEVGVRLAICTTRVDGKVAGNLSAIAASATMGLSFQNVHASVFGCPLAMAKAFMSTFAPVARFDMDALKYFGMAVSQLAADMVQHSKNLADPEKAPPGANMTPFDPQPLHVVEFMPPSHSIKTLASSNGYALHRITQGDSFENAMTYLRSRLGDRSRYPYDLVDPVSVRLVYDRIVGSPSQAPSSKQKQDADKIQEIGH